MSGLLAWWHGISGDVAAMVADQPGSATLLFTNRQARCDLVDPDGIVSVQSCVFTLPNGRTRNVTAAERGGQPGTWRGSTNSRASGAWSCTFEYTDTLGSGKKATAMATRA